MPDGLNRNGVREYLSVVIHCSDSAKSTKTETIREWHTKERGWSDIGYHYVIEGDGSLHVGRKPEVIGAGAEGWNEDSLHICVTGAFDKDTISLTDPQGKALVQLVATILKQHRTIKVMDIIGHKDVHTRLGVPQAKSCPGANLYRLIPELRGKVGAYL